MSVLSFEHFTKLRPMGYTLAHEITAAVLRHSFRSGDEIEHQRRYADSLKQIGGMASLEQRRSYIGESNQSLQDWRRYRSDGMNGG